jgi:probable F420-dependent oxidoreductase
MKFDLNLVTSSLDDVPVRVEQAKAAGYEGIFVAETRQDPFTAVAVAGSHVKGVDLGTSIALAFPRSPMVTAMTAWGLQRSEGRFILGLGSQVRKHIERRFSCTYDRPVARLREYASAVRHIWGAFAGEHELDFHGEFYELDFLPDFANPGPIDHPVPDIYLATVGPLMYKTAGAVADGAFVHPLHTPEYLTSVAEPAVAQGLAQRGAAREDFSLSVTTFAVVGSGAEADAMRTAVRNQLAFYASTPTYREVLTVAGWEHVGEQLQELVRAKRHADMPDAVPDAMLEDFSVSAATWPEAAQAIRDRYQGIADRVSFYNPPTAEQAIA